jgi:hypothetical protein
LAQLQLPFLFSAEVGPPELEQLAVALAGGVDAL